MRKTYGFWVLCFVLSNTWLLKGQSLDKTDTSEKPISVFDKPAYFSGWYGDILNPEELSEIRIGLFMPNDRKNPINLPLLNAAQLAISESNAAGGFYGVFSFVSTLLGWRLILIIIMISIVGGVGNVRGALIASVGAGILTAAITLVTKPLYGEVILLLVFIVVLRLKKVRV